MASFRAAEGDPAINAAGIADFHEQSKHDFDRFAAGPPNLDWANQPNPFRRYTGAQEIKLTLPTQLTTPTLQYNDLYLPTAGRRDLREPNLESLSTMFYFSMALSAWKQAGSNKWSLRVNPSSGNLHPTEAYVIAGPPFVDAPSILHYSPEKHALECRALITPDDLAALTAGLPAGSFLVALTSIPWRESWKYGVRAFRYCQHDTGHAAAAVALGASIVGWETRLWPVLDGHAMDATLGLVRGETADGEREHAEALIAVVPRAGEARGLDLDACRVAADRIAHEGVFMGKPNRLSSSHRHYKLIESAFAVTVLPRSALALPRDLPRTEVSSAVVPSFYATHPSAPAAAQMIRQRRSAVEMDGRTGISHEQFFSMLGRTVPALTPGPPWEMTASDPAWRVDTHLLLFVHRVHGIEPGLYALIRDASQADELRAVLRPDFLWEHATGAPPDLPLFLLEEGDSRDLAKQVSCGQDIAADGAFAVAMISRLERTQAEPHVYRKLFWETGMIGQVLYLEAEAQGIRSTGIGCFFDDPTHGHFFADGGDRRWQSLYHFTVGGPLEDDRLRTLEAYEAILPPAS